MNRIKTFAYGHPIVFSLIVMALSISLTYISFPFSNTQIGNYITGIIEQGIVGITLLLLIKYLNLFEKIKFTKPQWKKIWLAWPIIVYLLASMDYDFKLKTSVSLLISFTLVYISTGFFEEILCRGVMLNLFLNKWGGTKKGIYFSVILSSIIFGVFHLIHLFGTNPISVITNVICAFFIGVAFAAVYIRIKSIWSVIMLHAIFDILTGLDEISIAKPVAANSTLSGTLPAIIITSLLLIYGLFILRKAKIEKETSSIENSAVEI